MTIEKHTLAQIQQLEDRLRDVAETIRTIRREMQENDVDSVDMESSKAERYLDYLHTAWAHRSYSRFREQLARQQTAAVREKKRAAKKKARKSP